MNDEYPRTGKTLYLNIIWHQHQPLYLDPESDQLQGPWVRTHGTKDYYDMASVLEKFPDIHFTVNLTTSLLSQLQTYYVERLAPFVDVKHNCVDAKKYFSVYSGKTDPWIDLALKPTSAFVEQDFKFLLENIWNAFGVSEVMIDRFPEYKRLRTKYHDQGRAGLTEQDLREIKFWFYLANFDPDFLEGKQTLATGDVINVTDLVQHRADGTYILLKTISEEDCNRIIAETYKILAAIVPIHKKFMYHPKTGKGQIEILTTPYYHPILPLLYDSNIAQRCQPTDPLPSRFHYPIDAEAQVAKAITAYKKYFALKPTGMWPGEGSVAHEIISVLAKQGIQWIATDQKILERSHPDGYPCYYPYVVYPHNDQGKPVVVVFRETELSDKIGFVYKNFQGEEAAEDFIQNVLRYVPKEDEPDRLLTVILDGENAWEWYRYDNDGKAFQHALYRKLSTLFSTRQVVTTTVTEYLEGNRSRDIPRHPIKELPRIEWLWPGSWINANYDTWIGDVEENKAWEYLLLARRDLAQSGLLQPDPKKEEPRRGTKAWYAYRAWESMYAAEGSDWFWWYGTEQNAPSGDKPFDRAYLTHLRNIYIFAKLAGGKMPERIFEPIAQGSSEGVEHLAQGTMAQSSKEMVTVVFQCDAGDIYVRTSLFIVGNHELLGTWVPNKMRMYNDGTHGDTVANDNVWTVEMQFPIGTEIEYKFTNSGAEGNWNPGEEFSWATRKATVTRTTNGKMFLFDVFGKL